MAEVSEKKNTIIEIIIVIPSGELVSKKILLIMTCNKNKKEAKDKRRKKSPTNLIDLSIVKINPFIP